MGKNLLIIGNGFDLANNLPTKYGQFMDFANGFMAIFDGRFKNKGSECFSREEIDKDINGRYINKSQCLNENISDRLVKLYEKQHHIDGKEYTKDEKLIVDNLWNYLENNIVFDYFCRIRDDIQGVVNCQVKMYKRGCGRFSGPPMMQSIRVAYDIESD